MLPFVLVLLGSSIMLQGILTHLPQILVPIVVPIALVLFRRYFPAVDDAPDDVDLGRLDQRFKTMQWAVAALFVTEGVMFAFLTHWMFISLNRVLASREGPSEFQLYPSAAIWWFFPGFGAICAGWLAMELTLPLFMGRENARMYLYWTYVRSGFNGGRIMRWFVVLVLVPVGVFTAFAIPVHTTFHESEMHFRAYGAMRSEIHRYTQIRAITTTDGYRDRLGKFERDPRILLDFDDGTHWSSRDGARDPDLVLNVDLRDFLTKKTGLPTRYVPIDRDLSAP
jgi:hypothetical protein